MNGLALFDHPENIEHPGLFGEIAVPQQMSTPSTIHRMITSVSDSVPTFPKDITPEAEVESHYQCYANPPKVEICT